MHVRILDNSCATTVERLVRFISFNLASFLNLTDSCFHSNSTQWQYQLVSHQWVYILHAEIWQQITGLYIEVIKEVLFQLDRKDVVLWKLRSALLHFNFWIPYVESQFVVCFVAIVQPRSSDSNIIWWAEMLQNDTKDATTWNDNQR